MPQAQANPSLGDSNQNGQNFVLQVKINLTVPRAVFPSRSILLVVAFQHSLENIHRLRQPGETQLFVTDMSCLTCRLNSFLGYSTEMLH